MPTCAPFSRQLQISVGTDYRYRPEQFLNGIKTRTIYQLAPEPTNPDQTHSRHVRRMALVATSLDGPAFSWFNSLSEADTQDWSTFTLKIPKHSGSVTAQCKAQAEAQQGQLNTQESISVYVCRVEDLVNKGWSEYDATKRNRE